MAKRKKNQNDEGYKVGEKCRSEDRERPQASRKESGPRDGLSLIPHRGAALAIACEAAYRLEYLSARVLRS
jgi:hypothetical protein